MTSDLHDYYKCIWCIVRTNVSYIWEITFPSNLYLEYEKYQQHIFLTITVYILECINTMGMTNG